MGEDGKKAAPDPWPSELRVRQAGRALRITFADGFEANLSAEVLRAASPSADKSHPPVPEGGLRIVDIETVGNYAVRIAFNDGHETGIYSWPLLRALAAVPAPPAP